MKKIVILGSTGSVGKRTLEVVSKYKDEFKIVGLSAKSNYKLLLKQAKEFNVKKISILEDSAAEKIKALNPPGIKCFSSKNGFSEILNQKVDLLVLAISGTEAVYPLLEAIKSGIDIALANKESIISAGDIINKKLKISKSKIIPLDSEHNAIYQLLQAVKKEEVSKIILTCSGGPFLNYKEIDLKKVTPIMALSHPCWEMGKKITVDSATLMNKGFEIIEAHYLFKMASTSIKVLIHTQALAHGMVELCDGNILAAISPTNMQMPIAYALGFPERLDSKLRLDWDKLKNLTFQTADAEKIKALNIAYELLLKKMSYPAFLVKADEMLVRAFLEYKIRFTDILSFLEKALNKHKPFKINNIGDVEEAFKKAVEISNRIIKEGAKG